GEDVAVGDDERLGQPAGGVVDRAAGPERLGLDDVLELVAEVGPDGVGPVAAREHDAVDAVGAQVRDLVLEEGAVRDREHRLGGGVGQGAQAGPLPADQHDGDHRAAAAGGRPTDSYAKPAARAWSG